MFTTTIAATDFPGTRTDARWDAGKWRHTLAAIGQHPVALIMRDGSARLDVTVGWRNAAHDKLVAFADIGTGTLQGTNYRMDDVERVMLMPHPGGDIQRSAPHTAYQTYMAECAAAIAHIRTTTPGLVQRYGAGWYHDERTGVVCKWDATPTANGVRVAALDPTSRLHRASWVVTAAELGAAWLAPTAPHPELLAQVAARRAG